METIKFSLQPTVEQQAALKAAMEKDGKAKIEHECMEVTMTYIMSPEMVSDITVKRVDNGRSVTVKSTKLDEEHMGIASKAALSQLYTMNEAWELNERHGSSSRAGFEAEYAEGVQLATYLIGQGYMVA